VRAGFQPGDRVACAGVGYASHCEINFVPANLAVRVPDNVSLEAASLTTIGAIAVQGVRQANVTFGETVAVIGVGLVGVLAIQVLARRRLPGDRHRSFQRTCCQATSSARTSG
jgi:NADPH:quinone reductase-like Zn-dependent oxidoreductase